MVFSNTVTSTVPTALELHFIHECFEWEKTKGGLKKNESQLGEKLILPSFFSKIIHHHHPHTHTHIDSHNKYLLEACCMVFADAKDTTLDKTNIGSILLELRFKKQMKWTILGKYKLSKINSIRNRKQCNNTVLLSSLGFPGGTNGKELSCQCR